MFKVIIFPLTDKFISPSDWRRTWLYNFPNIHNKYSLLCLPSDKTEEKLKWLAQGHGSMLNVYINNNNNNKNSFQMPSVA